MEEYIKKNWGTFLIKNAKGKENKFYCKSYLQQTYGLSKLEIDQYLLLNLKILKIVETENGKEIVKDYHLIPEKDLEEYLDFRNKHREEFKKLKY